MDVSGVSQNAMDVSGVSQFGSPIFIMGSAHDYLHTRQVNNLRRAYLKETSGDLTYAGKW